MYDEFGNYLGPDLSDEEEDDEEEYAQQAQDQDMAEGDEEDVEMEEENVRTSTALSRLGGNKKKIKEKNNDRNGRQISRTLRTDKLNDLLKPMPSQQRSHRTRSSCTRIKNTTLQPRKSTVKAWKPLLRRRTPSP